MGLAAQRTDGGVTSLSGKRPTYLVLAAALVIFIASLGSTGLRLIRIDIDRPELRPNLPLAQPRKVGVHPVVEFTKRALRGMGGIVEIEILEQVPVARADLLGDVVVPVPHRGILERGSRGFFRRLGPE